ncbi:hypothetical protein BT69DRAFT_1317689 [Atractiella rhizophila]|nr:hypothetical protein BT69DRAFT_1317689 [Atractiella rhizophila]
MLLGLVGFTKLDEEDALSVNVRFSSAAQTIWQESKSQLYLNILGTVSSLDNADESRYPVCLQIEPSLDETSRFNIYVQPARSRISASLQLTDFVSESEYSEQCPRIYISTTFEGTEGVQLDISIFEQWTQDPFAALSNELIHLIFSSMIKLRDMQLYTRGDATLFRHLQRLRLVNRRFSIFGLTTLCKVFGSFEKPWSLTVSSPGVSSAGFIDPLRLFRAYPNYSAPYLRRLILKEMGGNPERIWKNLRRILNFAENLEWLAIFLPPPKDRVTTLNALSKIPSLKNLQLTGRKSHGSTRWNTEDLVQLLSNGLSVACLFIIGWDLTQPANFSGTRVSECLTEIVLKSNKLSKAVFEELALHLVPVRTVAPAQMYRFFFFTKYSIDTQTELRVLYIDAAHAASNVISPTFLQDLTCPHLEELQLQYCYLDVSTIVDFIRFHASQAPFAGREKFEFAWTCYFGDIPWTLDDFTLNLREADESPDKETEMALWDEGGRDNFLYDGKRFAMLWNEGGLGYEDWLHGNWD